MKRVIFLIKTGILGLVFIAFACTKDEASSVGFAMKATESQNNVQSANQALPPGDETSNLELEWDIAWIYITRLVFDAEYIGFTDNDGHANYPDFHYEWQGNQKIDLFGEPKFFANMELPEGTFKHFELTMTSARFGITDEPNFYLSGTYKRALGETPLAVSVTEEFEMGFIYDYGEINITDEGELFKSLVEISLDKVFQGITSTDLDEAELTNGWILISKDHNPDLYEKVLENLRGKEEDGMTWEIHEYQ